MSTLDPSSPSHLPGGKAYLARLDKELGKTVKTFQDQMHALGMDNRIDQVEVENLRCENNELREQLEELMRERRKLVEEKERIEKRLILTSTENHRLRQKLNKPEDEVLENKYKKALIYIEQLQNMLRNGRG